MGRPLNAVLEDMAMRRHRSTLINGSVYVDQWRGHESGYMDPEAAVGCEDGTVRVFDMYSKSCSRIIRMHSAPVTCLALGEDQLILSGSSLGSVTLYGPTSDQRVAVLRASDRTGIKTLCYNPSSQLVFTGSTAGYAACWDLRNDTSTLVVGGIDGVVRILDQNSGEVLSSCVMDERKAKSTPTKSLFGLVERKKVNRLAYDANISDIPPTARPPIKCLAVGMEKVVTTHNSKYIRIWKFTSKTRN
ncbi:hypothetical protein KSS87_001440 [Heliosperma pusillum]|nr:hypothetical protein KSS87_001440 [Heliosperma pusillum]